MGMRAMALISALILWTIVRTAGAPEPAQAPAAPNAGADVANRVLGHTAWDEDYLYVALQVNKPTISARNSAPFSHPLEDDAAIISLQTDGDKTAVKRTPHTITVAVSAADGFQLYSGVESTPFFASLDDFNNQLKDIAQNEKDPTTQQKKLLELQSRVIKVKVIQNGAERVGGGFAPGYTVEIAVPWIDLGGKPAAGARMGFNVAVQSKAAGSPALQSLSPGVKGASDVDNPSLWSTITLSNSPALSTPANLISPRVFAQKPVIDAEVSNSEWNGLSQFVFGEAAGAVAGPLVRGSSLGSRIPLEMLLRPTSPAIPMPPASTEPLPVRPHHAQKLPEMVMARWEYWYQSDTRKAAPAMHVVRSDGSSALAHHPLQGTGPWFSFDRADWHRKQLQDMRQAGVDVVLPIYRGAARDRQLYADKGLSVLASALQSLRQAGQDYPQVGLFLDTDALIQTFGDRPDLRQPVVQAGLYDLIRDFYRRIPAEFRCLVPLSAENGGHSACIVYLSDAHAFKDLDGGFVDTIRGRFLRDFGSDLILIGGPGFRDKAALDGYFAPTLDRNLQFDGAGWIKVASVGAGYDSALLEDLPPKPSHRTDDQYRAAWTAAVAKRPNIVLLDGWNDYAMGREIAPSIEVGYTAVDMTKVYSRALAGSARFGAKYLWNDVPDRMLAGARCAVHVRVQNTGQLTWGAQSGAPVAFHAVWKQGDSVVAESDGVQPSEPVLPGQNASLTIPAAAARRGGEPLPAGDYTLSIVPTSPAESGKNAAAESLASALSVHVHLAGKQGDLPAWAASVVRTDLPTMMETGSGYLVDATLRNDGAQAWRKGDRVCLRLYRTAPTTDAAAPLMESPVATADASMPLPQEVAPGQETQVHLLLPLVDSAGKPVTPGAQDDLWTYTARWEVGGSEPDGGIRAVSDATAPHRGVSFGPLSIVIGSLDFGVRFVQDRTPNVLPAERRQPVSLSILNAGPQTWKRDQVRIGYHWYYLDGTELRWEDALTPLTQDVPPGARVNDILVNVTAPSTDGTYFLMWDVKFGDVWASTSTITRPLDSTVHAVQVIGSRLVFADLTKAYNLDGVSDSEHLTGDFDGRGHAFPAEWMPPYTDAPVTPAAMWLPDELGGPESSRHISFRWGPKEGKVNNFVACRGQRVELGKTSGQCRVLHLVAASTENDVPTSLKLIFQEPTSQSEDSYPVTISRWDKPASRGEPVALLARRHYERDGIKPGAVALFHYSITVHEPRKLVAIQLPNTPEIKIAAITLEQ